MEWDNCFENVKIWLMYYAYIIELSNGRLYTGYSSNLRKRINNHQKGNVNQTRKYRPVKLLFYAAFEQKSLALDFEKYLKTSSGFAFRNKRLIKP
ncbi:GIY-YIG nuclease family protein [Patescibacteria group bacterium]